jgi:hypothetical protein
MPVVVMAPMMMMPMVVVRLGAGCSRQQAESQGGRKNSIHDGIPSTKRQKVRHRSRPGASGAERGLEGPRSAGNRSGVLSGC